MLFVLSSRRRHTVCALVTGGQTCALPIYDDAALSVDMADIAGMQPRPPVGFGRVGDEDALRLRFVAPIAVHDEFAAHQYLAIIGNADFGVHQRRNDGVHLEPSRRPVAADVRSEEHTSELQSLMRNQY